MAAIKSYTDIEQSKKLAEILPFESADMYWKNGTSDKYIQCFTPFVIDEDGANADFDYDVPCWSLAALLNVLPQEIFNGQYVINITEGLNNKWILTYDHCKNRNNSYYGLSTDANNLVDTCYYLILKLHELKLL